jgi:hypothetical protein
LPILGAADGPGNDLAARFSRDGAHAEWFYGFRLAVRTDVGRRIVRAWSIVPAAIDERQVGADLVAVTRPASTRCCWTRASPAAGSPLRWPAPGST